MSFSLTPGFSQRARNLCCTFCGGGPGRVNPRSPISPDREVVSTEVVIEFEGEIEFCQNCAVEIGALVGMIPKAQADKINAGAKDALARCKAAESERDGALAALAALNFLSGDEQVARAS